MPSLNNLHPWFRPYAELILKVAREYLDPRFVVTSAVRSRTDQQRLWNAYQRDLAAGRPVLTTLPPGASQHERGFAIDMARLGIPAKDPDTGEPDPYLAALGMWWRGAGGVWGGAADPVHFEAPKAWTGRS